MKKLLERFRLFNDMQYYEIIVEHLKKGNISFAKERYKLIPRKDRINLLKVISLGIWDTGLSRQGKEKLFEFEAG